ncbi:LysR family transcriptional regulator [uncultured Shimia sp.]|uniref:LysR substrate-binding domain-containing protein n=1 Tax=uncultured Shimia sp. TaxID=573152 RepID=UPI00260132E9|nr:LysR family transcriptional regulator [uncultured Shimia sp.]
MLTETSLEAFFHLAETNSFQEAARRMGVSNASLSRYIQQAEEQAGVVLFHRSRNNCRLTRAGQEFLPLARKLEQDLGLFTRQLELLRTGEGRQLRIGCGPLVPRALVQPVLREAMKASPMLRFQLDVSARISPLERLQNGEIDMFIGDLTHTPEADNVEIMMIAKRPVMFVARPGHPIHERGVVTLKEVFSYPFASPHLHKHWRATLIKALGGDAEAEEIVKALPQVESDDYHFLTQLAAQDGFIVGAVKDTFEEMLALGRLQAIETRAPITWNICAVRKTEDVTDAQEAFWQQLKAYEVNPAAA